MQINYPNDLFTQEELEETPRRIQGYLNELTANRKFVFKTFPNTDYDQMIICKDIDFASLCSHHLLPFKGKTHVGYIPDKTICGLSKLARTVDKFASRPQIQEQMTQQIMNFLVDKLNPKGVMVVVEASHDCMAIRGVKKPNSVMVTSAIHGAFTKKETKEEFLTLIK